MNFWKWYSEPTNYEGALKSLVWAICWFFPLPSWWFTVDKSLRITCVGLLNFPFYFSFTSLNVQFVVIEIIRHRNPSKEKYLDNKFSIIQKRQILNWSLLTLEAHEGLVVTLFRRSYISLVLSYKSKNLTWIYKMISKFNFISFHSVADNNFITLKLHVYSRFSLFNFLVQTVILSLNF